MLEQNSRVRWPLWLGVLVTVALALRVAWMLYALHQGFDWGDPDGYLQQAGRLTRRGWHMQPFMYGRIVKAPLYPVFLSAVGLISAKIEMWAALIQIALSAGAVAAVYVIGRDLHSPRAGAIAAGILAVWLPSLAATYMFLQEQLHVPLVVIGLALLVHAAARSAAPLRFGVAGAVLGLAALARSMPLYYIGPAALLLVGFAADRRVAVRQAGALLLGLAIVVLPWCVYASARAGQIVLIDNMGGAALGMAYRETRPDLHTKPPATAVESLGILWRAASSAPSRFFADRVVDFQRLFRLTGGQWLTYQPPAATRTGALALEGVARASDLLFALVSVLAPLGVVLARRRREAMLVGLWFGLHLILLVTFAWNGTRYRAPYEPAMIVLAAVVLAAGWARARLLALALALASSIAIGASVRASVPAMAKKATYGFDQWAEVPGGWRAKIVGDAGFNMFADGGFLKLNLIPADSTAAGRSAHVRVFIDGRSADQIALGASERQLQYVWDSRMAYVRLQATSENGDPAPLFVDVGRGAVIPWSR